MRNILCEKIIARVRGGHRKVDIAKSMNVHIQTVHKAVWDYKARGHTNFVTKKPRTSPVRTKELVAAIKADINNNPETSIRKLGRDHRVAQTTMRRVVVNELGLKSLATTPAQALTPRQMQQRLEMGRLMLNRLRGNAAGKILIFSDEKDFHQDKHVNRRNTRILVTNSKAIDPEKRFVGHQKFPRKAGHALWLCGS